MSEQQTNKQALAAPQGVTLSEKVVEQIRISDAAMQKLAAIEEEQKQKQAAVDALIPDVVETMVKHERITPSQKEKLAAALKDPVRTLELLIKTAGHRNNAEAGRLGQGVNEDGTVKTAAAQHDPASSLTNPYVGGRTTKVAQSSVNLFAKLGLASPSE